MTALLSTLGIYHNSIWELVVKMNTHGLSSNYGILVLLV